MRVTHQLAFSPCNDICKRKISLQHCPFREFDSGFWSTVNEEWSNYRTLNSHRYQISKPHSFILPCLICFWMLWDKSGQPTSPRILIDQTTSHRFWGRFLETAQYPGTLFSNYAEWIECVVTKQNDSPALPSIWNWYLLYQIYLQRPGADCERYSGNLMW